MLLTEKSHHSSPDTSLSQKSPNKSRSITFKQEKNRPFSGMHRASSFICREKNKDQAKFIVNHRAMAFGMTYYFPEGTLAFL